MASFTIIQSIWFFYCKHLRFTGQLGNGEATSLTTPYLFYPLHRHLDISRVIELTFVYREQPDWNQKSLGGRCVRGGVGC